MQKENAFQDYFPGGVCFGCGPANKKGLRIKSYWVKTADGTNSLSTTLDWKPKKHCSAGLPDALHGGTVGSLIDCHSIWTAIATAYRNAGRQIGTKPIIWYVTRYFQVDLLKPTPMGAKKIVVNALPALIDSKKCIVESKLFADDVLTATGKVVAVRVDLSPDKIRKLLTPPE